MEPLIVRDDCDHVPNNQDFFFFAAFFLAAFFFFFFAGFLAFFFVAITISLKEVALKKPGPGGPNYPGSRGNPYWSEFFGLPHRTACRWPCHAPQSAPREAMSW